MNAKEVYMQFLLAHLDGVGNATTEQLNQFLTDLGEAFKKDGV